MGQDLDLQGLSKRRTRAAETTSLVLGVAAANADRGSVIVAGVAGLVAGAMSMAAGEYVSVSSQADTEKADLERERKELASDGDGAAQVRLAVAAATVSWRDMRGLRESLLQVMVGREVRDMCP